MAANASASLAGCWQHIGGQHSGRSGGCKFPHATKCVGMKQGVLVGRHGNWCMHILVGGH